ncbi:hypothetical protein KR222_003490 [Zaprionus bogoriensis]|nr:hypothetical protein KR222_003490 [Zaprionus bogoriensis]
MDFLLQILLLHQLLSPIKSKPNPADINRSTQLLDQLGAAHIPFKVNHYEQGLYYTDLDYNLRQPLLYMRNITQRLVISNFEWIRKWALGMGKLQQPVPADVPFPCNVTGGRSPQVPSNISRLRPGDIDIVATFGDSTIAGTGMLSIGPIDSIVEYRGFSYTGGGVENWRTALTLPNILKMYNPQLYGYAVANTLVVDEQRSRFNVAEPMLHIQDLPFQAQVLIERMRRDPKVDMQRHWKLLSIHVGANDMCNDLCSWQDIDAFLRREKHQLYATLRMLKDNVPRLLINFILQPDVDNMLQLIATSTPECRQRIPWYCNCYKRLKDKIYYDASKRLLELQLAIVQLPEFRSDDFAIVPHGILRNLSSLWAINGEINTAYTASDCVHYTQFGHAVLAKTLWNNMLDKTDFSLTKAWQKPYEHFLCPRTETQFIRTEGDQF